MESHSDAPFRDQGLRPPSAAAAVWSPAALTEVIELFLKFIGIIGLDKKM